MKKLSFTKKRLLAYVFALLLPVSAITLGIIFLCAGSLITTSFFLTFLTLPVFVILALAFTIFYNTKIWRKSFISILLSVIFAFLFFIGYSFGEYVMIEHFENQDFETKYSEKITSQYNLMPSLSEIGNPIDIDFYNVFIQYFVIFTPETDYLICEYTPEEYKIQKSVVFEKYVFQEAELSNFDASCESTAELDGYIFRSLSIDEERYESKINYPKRMILIGYSDEANKIIYLDFYDDDKDYISSLSEFLNDDCGWKYIRKEVLDD